MSRPVRTYGRRKAEPAAPRTMLFTPPPSSPLQAAPPPQALSLRDTNIPKQSSLSAYFTSSTAKRKRPPTPPPSSPRLSPPPKKLTQLHFTQNALRSCADCGMSYMRGADDSTHAKHHARVVKGMPWGCRTSKTLRQAGSTRVEIVDLGLGAGGRIAEILETVDTVLSAPPLPPPIRARCKLVVAVASGSGGGKKPDDRVVGVVVAQPIKTAMRVLSDTDDKEGKPGLVDSGGGVVCDPTPLPTPLGIHRLFVVPAYRGTGLARLMLDAAAEHTVYGCKFDPLAGDVAFSQPTDSGRAVMQAWGGGAVRVFVDDERQL